MDYENFGTVKIRTYAAAGALPVEGTLIKIYGTDDYNKDVIYSLITDSDGVTKEISLPAPPEIYSISHGAPASPYAVYNVELTKEGFYPKRIDNVPIFSGTRAVLPIEMIPLAYSDDGKVISQSNLNSIIYENEYLQ